MDQNCMTTNVLKEVRAREASFREAASEQMQATADALKAAYPRTRYSIQSLTDRDGTTITFTVSIPSELSLYASRGGTSSGATVPESRSKLDC